MQHRERMSTTHSLGFRVEAVKMGGATEATAHKGGEIMNLPGVMDEVAAFIGRDATVRDEYVTKLDELARTLETSPFFHEHEMVGSSLLMLHDRRGNIGVWVIDFGKTVSGVSAAQ
jgi:1D-myo-inositol-triphosphate 3-kinase